MKMRQVSRGAASLAMASLATALILASTCGAAGGNGAADQAKEIASIKQTLAKRYPEVQVTDLRPSPVPGIYEAFSADTVVYVDRTGEYLIVGPMIATGTKANISQQALDARDSIKFEQLPMDKAIKTVRGSGERTLAVFADPDCPYCHNLEKELAGLGDVTIYTFLFPLTSLHPDARNKAHAIWCAQDHGEAWHDWMILDKAAPIPAAGCTQDPIDEVLRLGDSLNISQTPVLFLENGQRVSGSRTAAQLNALLGAAHADKLRAATAGSSHAKS
jgi:thiol:disulfide interchange protein DsbC